MTKTVLKTLLLLAAASTGSTAAWAQSEDEARIAKAKEVFESYTRLGRAFDSAAANLYADDAVIRNKRIYPDGQVREMTIPAANYKILVRQIMPLAKARGDTNTYSDVTYTVEGEGVRINATRYSELKDYSSPLSLFVKPSATGEWLIYEELSESRP